MSPGRHPELEAILSAEAPISEGYVFRRGGSRAGALLAAFRPGAETFDVPCLAFVLRHPGAGTILVDTGLHPDAGESLRRDFGPAMGFFFRGLRPAREPFDRQLRRLGIEPAAVGTVVMTHLHVDHTSGMRLLPNAEFVCAREEWSAATGGHIPAASGYVRAHLPPESRMRLLDFEAVGEPFGPFSRSIDLLGDGTVLLLSTPGHTAGHLSVLVSLAEGRRVLLVGDAAYTLRSIEEQILPALTADDEASRRSLAEIARFAEDDPRATVVPTHDPDAWRRIRAEP
jgi:N-acyl homoserine lactone hydrolase